MGSRVCPNHLGNEMLRPSWTRPLVEELEEFTIMPYRMSNVSGGGGNNSSLRSLITVQRKDLFLQKWSCHQSPRKNKCRKQTFLVEQVHTEYISLCISTYAISNPQPAACRKRTDLAISKANLHTICPMLLNATIRHPSQPTEKMILLMIQKSQGQPPGMYKPYE